MKRNITVEKLKLLAQCTEAIRLNSKDDTALSIRSGLYLESEAWDETISDCTSLLEINHWDSYAYNTRGQAFFGKGEYDKAIEDQAKALVFEHEGGWCFSYFWRGLAYLKRGEFYKAIADFDRADDDLPHDVMSDVLQNRAIAYDAIGEHQAAADDRARLNSKLIPTRADIEELVRGLVSGWCERSVLGPLKWVLPAWPMKKGAIDEWKKLRNRLHVARSIERKVLTNDEVLRMVQAEEIVTQVLSGN